jgi:hypothetical protein
MSNNKQTSVDQLFDQLSREGLLGLFTFDQMKRALEILDEAKAIHKEEIKNACQEFLDTTLPDEVINEYYNETYGGNNEQQ